MQPIDVDAIVKDFLNVLGSIADSLQKISLSLISTKGVPAGDSLEKIAIQTDNIDDALHSEDGVGIAMVFQDHFDELYNKEEEKED